MSLMSASVALIPPAAGNQMSFVGTYTYSQFKNAPLLAGDFAVYFSNFPRTEPTGGSGHKWTAWVGDHSETAYVATKVIEAGDIGHTPTNPLPAYDTDAVFMLFRGPGSISMKSERQPASYAKDPKHCGMFMVVALEVGTGFDPHTPATWFKRREQTVTWGGTSRIYLRFYDRLEPANLIYADGDPVSGTPTGSGGFDFFLFEFLVP